MLRQKTKVGNEYGQQWPLKPGKIGRKSWWGGKHSNSRGKTDIRRKKGGRAEET